jgi:hypothetical protein
MPTSAAQRLHYSAHKQHSLLLSVAAAAKTVAVAAAGYLALETSGLLQAMQGLLLLLLQLLGQQQRQQQQQQGRARGTSGSWSSRSANG